MSGTTEAKPSPSLGSAYASARALFGFAGQRLFDVTIEGASNVPRSGPIVVAANHLSFLDCLVLMYGLDREVMVLGKDDYMSSWKTRWFAALGMIPVDRSGGRVTATLRKAADVLDSGGAIGIFPEGTRSRDGAVHEGQGGAAFLAMRTGAALIPVGIRGTDVAQPIGSVRPRFGSHIEVHIGAPIDIGGATTGAATRRVVTRRLMTSISVLAARPYVESISTETAATAAR